MRQLSRDLASPNSFSERAFFIRLFFTGGGGW
jgi:hypothetical protein